MTDVKSRWYDDIIKDKKFFGVGLVNNQIHFPNGSRSEKPCEDRTFAYEFENDKIYAYGLLDGHNGVWAVDLVEQYILTNMYFDHLSTLSSKTDEEIYNILITEFLKTEQFLRDNQQDILFKRAELSIKASDLKKGSIPYVSNKKILDSYDTKLRCGTFALISLVIEKRLFIANVGTSHWFICKYVKKTNEMQVISYDTDHKITNATEIMRLLKLNANIDVSNDKNKIEYTGSLGDFKLKDFYHEYPQFKDCTSQPILWKPKILPSSIIIDDSFLFIAMFTDSLAKIIDEKDTKATIAKMLIDKITTEQTLNSAAQSVLDEVKRTYDDKYVSGTCSERGDLSLIVRSFVPNLKAKLKEVHDSDSDATLQTSKRKTRAGGGSRKFVKESTLKDVQETLKNIEIDEKNQAGSMRMSSTILSNRDSDQYDSQSIIERKNFIENNTDENGLVIPYLDLKQGINEIIRKTGENPLKEFEEELERMGNKSD